MDVNKYTQQAGDNSQQMQANNITIINNNGLTEEQVNERVKKVVNELIPAAIKEYTEEARETANERIAKLENCILPRISQVDGMIESFSDPAFQRLLVKAEQEAAVSEREADYSLLTELLVCHVKKGNDRKNRVGIEKAVEIVDKIDNDALCGLTLIHVVEHFVPMIGEVSFASMMWDDAVKRLEYEELPSDDEWIEQLEMLGAIRTVRESKFKKFIEYYSQNNDGYLCVGIKKDSENYRKAREILKEAKLDDRRFLIPNELIEGYARLNIRDIASVSSLMITTIDAVHKITAEEERAIKTVWSLYETDEELKKKVEESFLMMWDSHKSLKKLRVWWDNIPIYFQLTKVGEILAHTNAKRCVPYIPDMI